MIFRIRLAFSDMRRIFFCFYNIFLWKLKNKKERELWRKFRVRTQNQGEERLLYDCGVIPEELLRDRSIPVGAKITYAAIHLTCESRSLAGGDSPWYGAIPEGLIRDSNISDEAKLTYAAILLTCHDKSLTFGVLARVSYEADKTQVREAAKIIGIHHKTVGKYVSELVKGKWASYNPTENILTLYPCPAEMDTAIESNYDF